MRVAREHFALSNDPRLKVYSEGYRVHSHNSVKSLSSALLMIPTLNEEDAIGTVIEEARRHFSRILIVDGGSADRTREVAQSYGAEVIIQKFGNGKGCGVRTGMEFFLGSSSDTLCIIDGDGTNIPSELPTMIEVLREEGLDIVLGSRIRGKREPGAMDPLTYASNVVVSFLLGMRFGRHFTDVQTGYWAFSRKAVEVLYPKLSGKRFEIELEIFTRALSSSLLVREVPVDFRTRKGKTKFSFALRMRNIYFAFRYLLLP